MIKKKSVDEQQKRHESGYRTQGYQPIKGQLIGYQPKIEVGGEKRTNTPPPKKP